MNWANTSWQAGDNEPALVARHRTIRPPGQSRVPTGFIPIEDQGYLLVAVQLPNGAALDRTQNALTRVSEIACKHPGVDQVISISSISALDSSSSLANAGVAYLILKERSMRGKGEDLRSLFVGLNEKMSTIEEARILVVPPPPKGIGNAAGFAMQGSIWCWPVNMKAGTRRSR